jgi:hypothetical protein
MPIPNPQLLSWLSEGRLLLVDVQTVPSPLTLFTNALVCSLSVLTDVCGHRGDYGVLL